MISDFSTSVQKALSEIDPRWRDYKGLIVCGSHTPTNVETTIDMIREARETGIPFLGLCFGHQLAWIEYCRSVLGIKDATSEEFGKGTFVVKKRDEIKVGLHAGESWWSNYECDYSFGAWGKADNFISVAFHPEYQSSKGKPHPLLVRFLDHAKMAM